jgi:hypothetical protein
MEKKSRKETKEDSSQDKTKEARERKQSVYPGSLGQLHVQEIQDHNLLDKEADYEDISINLHVKDEDYAYPVDAVHEDREHTVYQHPIHPLGTLSRNFINPSERQENSMENYLGSRGKKFNASKRKFSLGVIMRKLSTEQMPVKERKTSLQEILVKTGLSRFITLPSFARQSFVNNCQVNSSSWEFLNKDLEENCKHTNVQTIHKNEVSMNNPELLSKRISQDSLYLSECRSSFTCDSSSSSSNKTNSNT